MKKFLVIYLDSANRADEIVYAEKCDFYRASNRAVFHRVNGGGGKITYLHVEDVEEV